jgi:hypothetical protein
VDQHPRNSGWGTVFTWLLLGPVLVGFAAWVWAGLETSASACARGEPIAAPTLLGSALLIAIALAITASLARRARLSRGEWVGYLCGCAVLSGLAIDLAQGLWLIGHHCAS